MFSVVGHWLDISYCMFMDQFGIVDDDSLVWDGPMYPFLVYGIGTLVCSLLLVPLKMRIIERRKTLAGAALEFSS